MKKNYHSNYTINGLALNSEKKCIVCPPASDGSGYPKPGTRNPSLIVPHLGGPGFGGCLVTGGGGFRRGPPPGEEGAPLTEEPAE